jgi:hypothetical protein
MKWENSKGLLWSKVGIVVELFIVNRRQICERFKKISVFDCGFEFGFFNPGKFCGKKYAFQIIPILNLKCYNLKNSNKS